jgi:hypothetical protein
MHFQAVLRMAGSVAHLQSLITPERIERFFMIDTKAAVLSLSVPAFPLEWEPPPLDNPTLTKIAPSASTLLSSLGKGLLSPQLSPVLGTELQALTSDLVQVVHLSEWTHLHPEDVTPPGPEMDKPENHRPRTQTSRHLLYRHFRFPIATKHMHQRALPLHKYHSQHHVPPLNVPSGPSFAT